jgi:hypothetical protein
MRSKKKMTEEQWLVSNEPELMLTALSGASDRKMRLFACAVARCLWSVLLDRSSREAVEVAERFAEGQASFAQLKIARIAAEKARDCSTTTAPWVAWNTACYERLGSAERAAYWCVYHALHPAEIDGLAPLFAHLLRDVFGNPYHPASIDPEGLTWEDGMIPKLTAAIYEDGDFERMPILGDALEEAGCTNQYLLDHCHQPGRHVKGCWVLDCLLGKNGSP